MPTLLLTFEGPLQSWGSGSKFDNRQTENIPTKSGIIGMIAAAMGRTRTDNLDDLNELVLSIRIDQPGTLLDDLQILAIPGQEHPYLGHKFYLSDAKFLVALGHADQSFLEKISKSLKHPVYPISLGRRNCVPTGEIVKDIVPLNGVEALRSYPWIASNWFRKRNKNKNIHLRIFTEEQTGFRQFTLKDHPVSFDKNHRQYNLRIFNEIEPLEITDDSLANQQLDFFAGAELCS